MLEPAIIHAAAIDASVKRCALLPRNRFWSSLGGWSSLEYDPAKSTWERIEMASVTRCDETVVHGFLWAGLDRASLCVTSLSIINFEDKPTLAFGRDLAEFMTALLTEQGFHSVTWTVIVGNPAEAMYDRMCERFGGRIVGIKRGRRVLSDQKRYDEKVYEILASDFTRAKGATC